MSAMDPPNKKRKRSGGQRQRLSAAVRDSSNYQCQSVLANFLINMFAWGDMSPQRIQHLAKLAVQDLQTAQENDAVRQDLYILANLGTAGAHKNKIHSELMGKVDHLSHLPQPYSIHIPLKEPHNACKQGLLLPHEMFARIYSHYKDTWNKSICLGQDTLKKFWYAVRGHPTMENHPIRSEPGYDATCIPLAMHGDGVPITGIGKGWAKTQTIWSWYSLTGIGHTGDMLFYIWAMYDKLCVGDLENGTLATFFAILRWSLLALYHGKWPSEDYLGKKHLGFGVVVTCFYILLTPC